MTDRPRLAGLILLGFIAITFLVSVGVPAAGTALAQTCDNNPVTVTSVQPDAVLNTAPTFVTVFGTAFDATSVVILQNFGSLATTFVSPTVLTASVPAGVPTGRYDVEVLRQDGECGVLENGLRVRTVTTAVPTATPAPTSTPMPTDFVRPLVVIQSYVPSTNPPLYPGQEFEFRITLQNAGQVGARNVIVFFPEGDVIPRDTGGTRAVGDLAPGATVAFSQPLRVDSNLGDYEAAIRMDISYTDQYGTPYSETSVLSFQVYQYADTPTPTPTLAVRPQLVFEGYTTTPAVLNPGTVFTLDLMLINVSGEAARQVVVSLQQNDLSLRSLAPLASSNVRYVEQIAPGERVPLTFDLAVNGDAAGGLVPVGLSIAYIDNYNAQHNDTETISLPVVAAPHFYIGFFEPLPEEVFVGDTLDLPVEVINIGAAQANVSIIEVTSDQLVITDGSLYVGPLDAGTSGTLIAQAEAAQAGMAEVRVRVHYLDSFQQDQVTEQVLRVEVLPLPLGAEPGGEADGEGEQAPGELTFLQRIWRAVLGFLGLGNRPAQETLPPPPTEEGAQP